MSLAGRVAIVTGAGRGIGRAIAGALIERGAKAIIADNGTSPDGTGADPMVARDAAAALGTRALAFPESVASPGAARQLVDMAVRRLGGIDIVVNNAAIRRDATILDADPGDWDAMIRNNLSSAFYLINAAAPTMRGRSAAGGWGRIVNVLPAAALRDGPAQAAHASAGAGLAALTRTAAFDLAGTGVTVNAIAPGLQEDEETQTVAKLVATLCLPASGSISGRIFEIRGDEVLIVEEPRLRPGPPFPLEGA